jgi:hypothetical protein
MREEYKIIESLKPYLPKAKQWIDNLIEEHSSAAKPLSSFHFPRLPEYFSVDIIANTKVVIMDKMPQIPFENVGFIKLSHLERVGTAAAALRQDTIFVEKKYESAEALFFHELVHILQWRVFGNDDFLLAYGMGLMLHQDSYTKIFFESMAYKYQSIFQSSNIPFNVEKELTPEILRYKARFKAIKELV